MERKSVNSNATICKLQCIWRPGRFTCIERYLRRVHYKRGVIRGVLFIYNDIHIQEEPQSFFVNLQ